MSQSADAQQDTLYLNATYQKGATNQICLYRSDADKDNPEGWTLDTNVNNGTFAGWQKTGSPVYYNPVNRWISAVPMHSISGNCSITLR